jgi:O-antigen/teichoic acid export membrane protein
MQIKVLRTVLRPGAFIRHVLTLVTGNVVAQLLLVITIPLLTRLYRPSDIGVQALFYSIVTIIGIMSGWRYPMAIVQTTTDREAVAVMKLSLVLIMGTVGVVAVILALIGPHIMRQLGQSNLISFLWCIPVAVMLTGFAQVNSYWTIKKQKFYLQSLSRVSSAVTTIIIQISLGLILGARSSSLILGLVMGMLASALIYAGHAWRHDRSLLLAPMPLTELGAMFRRYRQFPIYSLPGSLFNEAVSDIPTFLLTGCCGTAVVGLFSMARKALGMPISLIADAVSQVAHQRIAAAYNAGRPGFIVVLKIFSFLLALIVMPMLLLFLCAPYLFAWILGPAWLESGRFVRALIPMFALKFAVQPITRTFLVYERQLGGLLWQGSYFLLSTCALIAGLWWWSDPVWAVFFYSLIGSLMYLVILALSIRWSGGQLRDLPSHLCSVVGAYRDLARRSETESSEEEF